MHIFYNLIYILKSKYRILRMQFLPEEMAKRTWRWLPPRDEALNSYSCFEPFGV
jgi:hypothetical protein